MMPTDELIQAEVFKDAEFTIPTNGRHRVAIKRANFSAQKKRLQEAQKTIDDTK